MYKLKELPNAGLSQCCQVRLNAVIVSEMITDIIGQSKYEEVETNFISCPLCKSLYLDPKKRVYD